MNITAVYDFLVHDVAGNLAATALATAAGYALTKIKRHTPPQAPPAQNKDLR
ncbi:MULTISPECIES: hypothetical protein [unclassified Streptomyces]|uniref:hypothetical protein n=1 Tax=unclassified Streptomyces TaxID=2593676 RepID=UPI002E178AD2|nr:MULTISPECIES: hypothetical protein [unclassified Streptomyces]